MKVGTETNCCGLTIAENFSRYSKKEFLEELESDGNGFGKVSSIAVLTYSQKERLHARLIKDGWRLIHEGFYNPVHNNILFLYMWEPKPTKSPGHPKYNPANKTVVEETWGEQQLVLKKGGWNFGRD